MQNQAKRPFIASFMMVLVLGSVSALVSLAQSDINMPRRQGENDASYQARLRARDRYLNSDPKLDSSSLIYKQPGETDETYQERLQITINGLLYLRNPEDPKMRNGETQASFQARLRMAEKNRLNRYNHLIALSKEDKGSYLTRLRGWVGFESSPEFRRRQGESASGYQKRFLEAVQNKLDALPAQSQESK